MTATERQRIAVVTGSRAEFGLLAPVMRAIEAHAGLELRVIVAGAHLLAPARTGREVAAAFRVDAEVEMQMDGQSGRAADALALGRGVAGFARALVEIDPDWTVVLGDRIEPMAAACAASVGGFPLAHLHGGDRAEGVADEAMRHAISKLAHLHFPATEQSRERLVRMGEDPQRVHVVGSPAMDGLADVAMMNDAEAAELGDPDTVFLMHPVGASAETEFANASCALEALRGRRVLALAPNHDPGREGIVRAIEESGVRIEAHLARERFVGLLKRLSERGGLLVGNSSAGLIEAAALRVPAVNIGRRQNGRERGTNVVDVESGASIDGVRGALESALKIDRTGITHPFGDGRTGERVANILAKLDKAREADARAEILRKRCTH